jgi:hypothetical protein
MAGQHAAAGRQAATGRHTAAGPVARWLQHGACISLMALVAVACAVGASLPAAETATRPVQYREADSLLARGSTAPVTTPVTTPLTARLTDTTMAGAQQ